MAKAEKRALNISASLEETITKELAQIRKEIEKTNKKLSAANKAAAASFRAVKTAVTAVAGAVVALKGLEYIKEIAAQTDAIGKLATATNSTTEQVSELQYAFTEAGGSAESFTAVLSSLLSSQRGAIEGSQQQVQAFEAFGLSMQDLRTLNPTQLLAELANGLGNIEDATDQTLTLATLFPEQWRNVINLIEGGGETFQKRLEQARRSGATVTQQQADNAAKLQDALSRLQVATDNVGRELLNVFGPVLVEALDTFAQAILNNKAAVVAAGEVVLNVIGAVFTTALKVMSGALAITESLGLSKTETGTPEQIAASAQKAADAALASEAAFNRLLDAQKTGVGDVQALNEEFLRLSETARQLDRQATELASSPAVNLERLIFELEQGTVRLSGDTVASQTSLVFSRLRQQFGLETDRMRDDARAQGESIGKELGLGIVPGISAAVQQATVAEEGGLVDSSIFAVDWDAVGAGYDKGLQSLRQQVNNFEETVGQMLGSAVSQATDALAASFQSMIEGTKSAKEAWKDFGSAVLRIIAQIIAKAAALKITQAVLGLADGGVLPGVSDDNASLPVQNYARGGVARSPQLAVFGEGNRAEAFVPLPDNRSIPVTINGGGGMGGQQVNLNVYAWDSKDAARGLIENRQVLQQIFTSQADNLVSMRQTIQRAAR